MLGNKHWARSLKLTCFLKHKVDEPLAKLRHKQKGLSKSNCRQIGKN